jgi:hypothetical protein
MEFRIESDDLLNADSRCLQQYRNDVTTQKGEDGIFAEIFKRIGVHHSIVCDVGASDGFIFSNSWRFVNEEGWSGILVEGDATTFQSLVECYKDKESYNRVCLVAALVNTSTTTLDSIIDASSIPEDFDLLSIDVDGTDWHIWNSLVKYKPRVVCMEFNPAIPNNVYYVQDDDVGTQKGSSLRAMIELGKDKGYELVATTDFNAIFVRDEYYPLFGIADNSIHAMHSPGGYESVMFQFYDGTTGKGGALEPLWTR